MKIIVGLTTIFDRQKQCSRALESLLNQTRIPDEIYVFVSSKPNLLDKGIQPYCLDPLLYQASQKDKRIHVEWIDNSGPYRKLLPLLKKFWQQDVTIITCDDDVVYKRIFIEQAEKIYQEKKCCIGFLGTRVNSTFQYSSFQDAKGTVDLWNLPKGVGGIVYNASWFQNKEIFNYKEFPTCDDLWFFAWRIAANVDCYITEETSIEQSLAGGVKGNLWSSFNETKNSDFLERILYLFCYQGWIKKKESFFSDTIYFQWNTYIQTKLLPLLDPNDLEGNIWSHNHSAKPDSSLVNKQKNIVWLARQYEKCNMLEVGFNAGFSALLFLLANPSLTIQGIDLGDHPYAYKCYDILKQDFGDRVNVIFGDSREKMPSISSNSFDMIHIDGGHSEEVARSDIEIAIRIIKSNGYLVIDDTNLGSVKKAIQSFASLKELKMPFLVGEYKHSLYTISS